MRHRECMRPAPALELAAEFSFTVVRKDAFCPLLAARCAELAFHKAPGYDPMQGVYPGTLTPEERESLGMPMDACTWNCPLLTLLPARRARRTC